MLGYSIGPDLYMQDFIKAKINNIQSILDYIPYINNPQTKMIILHGSTNSSKINHLLRTVRRDRIRDELQTVDQNWQMAIEAIFSAQFDDSLAWKQAHLPIGKAGLAIGIVEDHPDTTYISSCLGTARLVNKLIGRNDADADPTDALSAEFERLCQRVNSSDLAALDKILQFNPEAPGTGIQSKIMHLMNETEYDRLFANSNMRNKGRLLSLRVGWASSYLTALPLPYLGLTLPPCHFQRVV
jgi:hypothetical protein